MKSIPLLAIFFLIVSPCIAQWTIDAETALVFPGYNDVRIPNQTGTLFSFKDDFEIQGPLIPTRVRIGYTFGDQRNHVFALWAPLFINYEGQINRDIRFQNSIFEAGQHIEGFYQFNSYRLTYRRDFFELERWLIGLGFTSKIRDASVRLDNNDGISDRKDDVGFVPLLHLYAEYGIGNSVIYFEGDGLAGGPGRAFDLFIGTRINVTPKTAIKTGYRLLEGGANVEEVYNFTLVQFAVLGLFFNL